MAETQQQSGNQSTGSADRPATPQSTTRRSSAPAVFGDGSTREQQEAILKAKKETDQLVKAAGDADRKARSDS